MKNTVFSDITFKTHKSCEAEYKFYKYFYFTDRPRASQEPASPLIVFQSHPLPESRVERDRVRTILVQMSQDEVPHPRVQLPDAGRHDGDGERSLMMRGHLLLSLFLATEMGTALTSRMATCCAPASSSRTLGSKVSHHKFLCQFVLDKVQALWIQCDGHRASTGLNRFSREQVVDLVKDLLQLGAWV